MGFKPNFKSKRDDIPDNINDLPAPERVRIMSERIRLLHIYAQHSWHGECKIVGNKNALIVLRDAIDEAIRKGSAETGATVSDGEGYTVEIEMCDADWESDKWQRQPMPYTADYAKG